MIFHGIRLPLLEILAVKRVIFCDLDGTLVHTQRSYASLVVNRTQSILALPQVSQASCEWFWSAVRPRDEYIREVFGWAGDPHDWWAAFRQQDDTEERLQNTKALVGAHDALVSWRRLGKEVAIITASPQSVAEAEVGLLGLPWSLTVVALDGHHKLPPKPHPAVVWHLLKRFRASRFEAVYIGDNSEDSRTAYEAGVD